MDSVEIGNVLMAASLCAALVGLAGGIYLSRSARREPPERNIDEIVARAPYARLDNTLRVKGPA